jgi:hypothetical protein
VRKSRKGRPLPAQGEREEPQQFNKNKEGVEVSRLPHLNQRMRVARVEGQGVVVLLYTFYPLFSLTALIYSDIQVYEYDVWWDLTTI